MTDMSSYKDAFLAESGEFLLLVTDGLLALESEPAASEPVEAVFRGAHSLKGMSAAMGYSRTADLTHRMEGLMDRVRKGELAVDSGIVNLMLSAVDLVRDLIADESEGASEVDPTEMMAALDAACNAPREDDAEESARPADLAAAAAGRPVWRVGVTLETTCVLKAVRAYMVIKRLSHIGEIVETVPSAREIEDERFDTRFEVVIATVEDADVIRDSAADVSEVEDVELECVEVAQPVASTDAEPVGYRPGKSRGMPKLSETQTVRIAIGHLDSLVDLVGELVILRSRLERHVQAHHDPELADVLDEFVRISKDLQYEVLLTRMVPVGNIFNRFPRMVRDLAHDLGKQIEFRIEGLGIELDRTVLDEIGDPLVHLLRNSIDHGIEPAEERVAAGKPAHGQITLSAVRGRNHISICVKDDGRGIDIERVWQKAVESGVVDPSQRAEYDDTDILLLTCQSGFSTAEKATKVSGRGVGMDVVKGKIEHLGGTLTIRTEVGSGSEFILQLPLTLAIVPALLLQSRGQTYAIPLASVDEAISVEDASLESVGGSPVVIHRDGSVVPVVRLDALLFGEERTREPEPHTSIVFVATPEGPRALHVDALLGRREIVVKPLSGLFRDHRGFSGATILGDGRVVLILDPRSSFEWTEERT